MTILGASVSAGRAAATAGGGAGGAAIGGADGTTGVGDATGDGATTGGGAGTRAGAGVDATAGAAGSATISNARPGSGSVVSAFTNRCSEGEYQSVIWPSTAPLDMLSTPRRTCLTGKARTSPPATGRSSTAPTVQATSTLPLKPADDVRRGLRMTVRIVPDLPSSSGQRSEGASSTSQTSAPFATTFRRPRFLVRWISFREPLENTYTS